jgi:hypothetical protein
VADRRRYTDDVPEEIERRVREICLELPDAVEQPAWVGTRWRVRQRTFAHVQGLDDRGAEVGSEVGSAAGEGQDGEAGGARDGGALVVLAFRSSGEELEVLRRAGHPFLVLGWGRDALGMVLDAETDWGEVHEIITESYCALAPQKLVALVERPEVRPGDVPPSGSAV